MASLAYLNLGCGYHYHPDWVNVDFIKTGQEVVAHNLLAGIPFEDNTFEAVYHSHVLKHFPKAKAGKFIQECYRVLQPGGVIRVAVPDLSRIVAHYQRLLANGLANPQDEQSKADYDWIMLELYDQCVRDQSGGEMMQFLTKETIPNLPFIYERIGHEGQQLREHLMANRSQPVATGPSQEKSPNLIDKISFVANHPIRFFKGKLKNWLFAQEQAFYDANRSFTEIGKFRLGGEIHQWMYDPYSLAYLLTENGFVDPQLQSASHSHIPHWQDFGLDVVAGEIRKPDSLFMEAKKNQ